ncbi:ethanolamine permease [Paraburkholderia phenoliruptrix]|uniref:Putative amino acid permease YhdG n=1 Tax=Paraburkholderia phenoliruptrix TaxID=252970 RepID=A0A6J5K4E5_9BURK|nr:ethanolamine permease [Paraburkholderia phenoliruptrix]CAB4048656.1 putative amino acid permease YhdG [Paraburkholderia phenoliruptrix]
MSTKDRHQGTVSHHELKQTLGTWQLWAIAVGLVISGEYFGWSLGWAQAGTLGFLATTIFIAAMFMAFIFSFTELSTSIPHAGGPFAYAHHAFGETGGYLAGAATLIQYVFTPPTIALAIGGYLSFQFKGLDPKTAALGAYAVFMLLNIVGIQIAAAFELVVTAFAIFELLVFMGVVSPGFAFSNFVAHGWSGQDHFSTLAIPGMFAAIPFAVWFFGCIDGVAMAAEEAKNPRRSIPRAYIGAVVTLVVLAFGVMIFAGGTGDWRQIANKDAPLPEAMKIVVGEHSGWLHMMVWLGLGGLVASFHGIILGYSRQIFAQARAGYLPRFLANVNPMFKTPHWAILIGGVIGVATIYVVSWVAKGGTDEVMFDIAVISVLGMMAMYGISMLALFKLRFSEPNLARPFRAPGYPFVPAFALFGIVVSLASMVWFYPVLAGLFVAVVAVGYVIFRMTRRARDEAPSDEMIAPVSTTTDF